MQTPVPHDIPWYYIASMILGGGAITTWGFHGMAKEWVEEGCVKTKAIIPLMDLFSLFLCLVGGGIAGHRAWDIGLGSVVGLAGGLGYKLFMRVIYVVIRKKLNGGKGACGSSDFLQGEGEVSKEQR